MTAATKGKYIQAIGRRKTATAQVRLYDAKKTAITVNDKSGQEYFYTSELFKIVNDPFNALEGDQNYEVTVVVRGGGIHAQAEAVRHGISRALVEINEEFRSELKKNGFMKRDPRKKERKKFGLKKARKSAQWSKR